jgi:hypothetical protein
MLPLPQRNELKRPFIRLALEILAEYLLEDRA